MATITEPVPIDDITHWAPPDSCRSLHMLRLDRIHPLVSGNKWFKLRPNIAAAKAAGYRRILSFGGSYSNHLVALAAAAKDAGLDALGIVPGNYPVLTRSLETCIDLGMRLRFVSRGDFQKLKGGTAQELQDDYPDALIVPEGGSNSAGINGAAAIAALIPEGTTDVAVSVGTGGTLAGIESALHPEIRLRGICTAADCTGAASLLITARCPERVSLSPAQDPRFGRWKPGQVAFMQDFRWRTGIELDVVYTAKLMQLIQAELAGGVYREKQLVCIHTGGLQGNPPNLFADA